MKLSEFQNYKPKTLANVIVFACEDEFILEESRAVWGRLFGSGWVFEKLGVKEFEEIEAAKLAEEARTPSLFSQSRVLLVAHAEKLTKTRIADLEALQQVARSSLRVILQVAASRAAEALGKSFPVVEIDPLRPAELARWLVERHGLQPDIARHVVENAEPGMFALHNEMEKLKTYVGPGRPIEIRDVDASILRAEKFGPFELDDAILARNYRKTAQVVGAMLDEGMEPLIILSRITRVWRQLFVGKGMTGRHGAKDVAAAAMAPAWKASEFAGSCKSYGWSQLASGFRLLLHADRTFKTSSPDAVAYFDVLLWKLITG
jgi:DNA polymerase-3 subunit delta